MGFFANGETILSSGAINTPHHIQNPAPSKVSRARSLPSSKPFNVAVFFSALHYLTLLALITSLVMFIDSPGILDTQLVVGSLIGAGFTWFIAFAKRRCAFCPLCKGTPLINSGARVHSRAKRLYPLNHGVSASISIIANQKFSCMYCGSEFDLLKTPSHLRDKQES